MRSAAAGCVAAQAEAVDEIVDVGEMVVDLAAAEDVEAAPRDAAKQLQQAAIAGPVDAGRPDDDDLDAGFAPRLARATLSPSSFVSW